MKINRTGFFYKNISKIFSEEKFFSTCRIITPLSYFGQRESIINDLFKLPKNGKPINCFYDPFSGSGSISFAAMEQKKAKKFYLNDSLPMLKNFWEWVSTDPKLIVEIYCEFIEKYYQFSIQQRIEFYEKLLSKINCQDKILKKPYYCAVFAFLINFSEKNIILFNENMGLATKPNLDIDHESKLSKIKFFDERTTYLSCLLQLRKVFFSSGDYHKSIENAKKGDLIIFDPPYPQQKPNIYYNLKNEVDLRKSLFETFEELNEKEIDFIVLYGAGDIPLNMQFKGLQHLVRLSCHPFYGEFLEHLYVSPVISLKSDSLPTGIVFYDQLFKPCKNSPSLDYNQALYILQSLVREKSICNGTNIPGFK